jgi:hypothetical protein
MDMNECVKRLAILYMVKSGRIAKSAQGKTKLLSDLWRRFTGRARYVRPGMATIEGAVGQATPYLRHEFTKAYREAVEASIGAALARENVPPRVRKLVLEAAKNEFDNVRLGEGRSIREATDAAKGAAQKIYNLLVKDRDIDLINLAIRSPDTDMIISQHYGPLRDILRGLGDLDKDPNVFSEMWRHLDAVGRGSLRDKRELPGVIGEVLEAQRPISDVARTAVGRGFQIVGAGLGAYEIGKHIIGAGSSGEQPSSPQGAPAQPQNVGARQAAPASELFDYGARLLDAK